MCGTCGGGRSDVRVENQGLGLGHEREGHGHPHGHDPVETETALLARNDHLARSTAPGSRTTASWR